MNCLEFIQRLDTGDLEALAPEALAHVADCTDCARELMAARRLESAFERHLSGAGISAPQGLADAVMTRVRARQAQPRTTFVPDLTPWWVGAAAQPSVAGAMLIAALIAWRGAWLLQSSERAIGLGGPVRAFASGPIARANEWLLPFAQAFVPARGDDWTTALAIALCLSPLALLASYALYRAGERLFEAPDPRLRLATAHASTSS
ncbi:MAG: hypothetical protein ABIU54_13100 [Candidatus Eisenbacteria bacterium]